MQCSRLHGVPCRLPVLTLFHVHSPFMRNAEVIIALLFGYLMAGVITREGQHYVSTANITSSPGITFLWVKARLSAPLCVGRLSCVHALCCCSCRLCNSGRCLD